MPRREVSIDIDLGDLTEKNVGLLKLLNQTIFPVKYPNDFYTNLLSSSASYTKLGWLNSK